MSPAGIAAAGRGGRRSSFVLVHGAWRGGWCWRRVADRLEALGHKVFAPTLTGLGERSHLLAAGVGLATHVEDVANLIRWEGLEEFVLVGHSYGGFVVACVAERLERPLAALVLVDAFVPDDGECVADLASANVRAAIAEAIARGDATLAPPPAAAFRVNEADRAWMDARCTPHPLACFSDRALLPEAARERARRKTYVRATGFPSEAFDAARARLRADRTWRVHDLACGHDAMVDMPDELAGILRAAA